jgi:ADP-ribose pyrophosphatase YjhB (NUDIX family)
MNKTPVVSIDQEQRRITVEVEYPPALPRVGSAVLVEKDGKVLLGRRQKDPGRGDLVIPGGGVKPFESIAEAGVRELREETGLDITIIERIGAYELINRDEGTHKLIVYSRAQVVGGVLRADSDVSDLQFFSRAQLAKLEFSPLIRLALSDAGWLGETQQ